jgi:hypothetical protein
MREQHVMTCLLMYVCLPASYLQEIVGLGLANFAGSAFNAYSTTGSFSRSAVNYDSGAHRAGCAALHPLHQLWCQRLSSPMMYIDGHLLESACPAGARRHV